MLAPQRFLVLGGFGALVLLALVFYNSHDHGYSIHDLTRLHSTDSPIRKNLHSLFTAVRQPIDADYVDASGKHYERPAHLTWPKPLGKKVLIVDIDTRVPDGDNELMGNKTFEWEKHQSVGGGLVTNGIMNHYLYAQIHGYDYKYYQAQPMPGYYSTWIRPHILASLLRDYDFVITLDADVTSTHLEVPFEWLFNKWNITKRTSIAMPWDVEEQRPNTGEVVSTDSKGVQVFNAGFVIVQKLPLTFEILREWGDCPTEKRYPGCKHWLTNWSHEQRAFSEYIRYDYNPQGDNIVAIPCDDAMSWPGAPEEYPGRIISNCHGNFFRHHTLNKMKPKDEFQNSVMQLVGQMLQKEVKQDMDKIWVKEAEEKEKEAEEATIA